MSQMRTSAVFMCRHCHRNVVSVEHLSTTVADPDGKLLFELMRGLRSIALCDDCKKKYNYYARQGRIADFEAGRP